MSAINHLFFPVTCCTELGSVDPRPYAGVVVSSMCGCFSSKHNQPLHAVAPAAVAVLDPCSAAPDGQPKVQEFTAVNLHGAVTIKSRILATDRSCTAVLELQQQLWTPIEQELLSFLQDHFPQVPVSFMQCNYG